MPSLSFSQSSDLNRHLILLAITTNRLSIPQPISPYRKDAEEVRLNSQTAPKDTIDANTFHSGIARSLRASAFARPGFQRSFQPIKPAFASQRFASTDSAKDGKIHQVIGAVVDGTLLSGFRRREENLAELTAAQ